MIANNETMDKRMESAFNPYHCHVERRSDYVATDAEHVAHGTVTISKHK